MGKCVSAVSATAAEHPGVGAVALENWGMELKPDSSAFAVQVGFVACSAGTLGERLLIFGDYDSDEHLCPVDFVDHVRVGPLAHPLIIRDVSSKILNVYGTRRIPVLLDGVVDCVIPFRLCRREAADRQLRQVDQAGFQRPTRAVQEPLEKGFSSSAILIQTSICAQSTSQTLSESSHLHIL
jgi:hypothetical protein